MDQANFKALSDELHELAEFVKVASRTLTGAMNNGYFNVTAGINASTDTYGTAAVRSKEFLEDVKILAEKRLEYIKEQLITELS